MEHTRTKVIMCCLFEIQSLAEYVLFHLVNPPHSSQLLYQFKRRMVLTRGKGDQLIRKDDNTAQKAPDRIQYLKSPYLL